MKQFMDKDSLLTTETAKKLYQDFASQVPVLDYHCHINPREIAEDRKFENITQVWLGDDHYKWRQMRSNGIDEKYITGDATDREKFQKWAETLEKAIGTILGCFQDSAAIGKIQQGSAWWFNDHKQGMRDQMISLANLGLLGNFIGMLTDSRSFLSYTRHEYFRRIMCDLIGSWVDNGEYPADMKALEKIVKGISYYNAVRYFGFDLK